MTPNRVGGVYRVEIIHTLDEAATPQKETTSELSDLIMAHMSNVVSVEVDILYAEPIRAFERLRSIEEETK